MSEEIIKVLDYICGKFGIAIDWTAENVMPQVIDIFSRYRIYEIVLNSIGVVLSICGLIAFYGVLKKIINSYKICVREQEDTFWWIYYSCGIKLSCNAIIPVIIFCIVLMFSIAYICACGSDLMQWAFIPEIKILEMLKGYVQ